MEILSFFLPAVMASLLALLTDASKWWTSGIWDWSVFWGTKIRPFLISLAVAVIVYLALTFAPFLQPALEALAQASLTEISAFALMGFATALIDNLTKPKPTVEEQRLVAIKYDILASDATLKKVEKQ